VRDPLNPSDNRETVQLNPILHEVLALTLETTAQFCSWIPLNGIIPVGGHSQDKLVPFSEDFLKIVCQYAAADMTGIVVSNEFSVSKA
jgi:hypothetical protein